MANTESTDLLGRASSSVAALTHTAHDLVGMLLRAEQQPEADGSLASLTRTVQAGSDAHWAVVARAAASLDAVAAERGDASGEVALLLQQRRELQEVVAPPLPFPLRLQATVAAPSPQPSVRRPRVLSQSRRRPPGGAGSEGRHQGAGRPPAPTDERRTAHGRTGGPAAGLSWGGVFSK